MQDMTNEEYDALDEYYTENTIMPILSEPGFFARKYGMMVQLDPETTCALATYAESVRQTPAQVISELVREKIAASA